MFRNSYQIFSLFGIPIKLDFSLIILVIWMWIDFGFARGLFAAVTLLAAIVLHELGHSLVAQRMGCHVREITLLLIGGRAMLDHIPRKPWQEMLVALAGPAVSAALGLVSLLSLPYVHIVFGAKIANWVLWHCMYLNFALCVFNLLPAFPMDGGRVLRAALAHITGYVNATRIAMIVGRSIAVLMAIYALWPKPQHEYMLLLVAIFVFSASGQEYQMVLREASWQGQWWQQSGPPNDRIRISPPPYER